MVQRIDSNELFLINIIVFKRIYNNLYITRQYNLTEALLLL